MILFFKILKPKIKIISSVVLIFYVYILRTTSFESIFVGESNVTFLFYKAHHYIFILLSTLLLFTSIYKYSFWLLTLSLMLLSSQMVAVSHEKLIVGIFGFPYLMVNNYEFSIDDKCDITLNSVIAKYKCDEDYSISFYAFPVLISN